MAKKQNIILLAAGATALLLMSDKKKKYQSSERKDETEEGQEENREEKYQYQDLDIEDQRTAPKPAPAEPDIMSAEEIISKYLDPQGRARLGKLYQIKPGDIPLEVCREALFGSREPVADPDKRRAVRDLLVRIDCSPWNQANYGVPLEELMEGHASIIDEYMAVRGVSFYPRYQDNLHRMLNGMQPTSEPGNNFALAWIPMIDVDRFDSEGVVTIEGMNYPDTENGIGGSMIDPPPEIVSIGFASVTSNEVGCPLPEGDFRKTVIPN